jgi:hypothetical protein
MLAIDRSDVTWNKPLAMTRSLTFVATNSAAAAAWASYYYPKEAGTS